MSELYSGIKTIQILARCSYPIVSAYEFEFLKTESEVQDILRPSTIYLIAQRPLTYFSNLRTSDGLLCFEVRDNRPTSPLCCMLDLSKNGFAKSDEDLSVELQFYSSPTNSDEPFDNVAGIKLRDLDGEFLFWMTPQKFIHHVLTDRLVAEVVGDLKDYVDYHVHYVGQAFSQDVWNRLTGHEKLQAILTLEEPLDRASSVSSLEISLILIDIVGFDEACIFPNYDFALRSGVKPVIHQIDIADGGDSLETFYSPSLDPGAAELTNEIEAMLVSQFRPAYNKILFNQYPDIANGTRSAGYTDSSLVLESMPASLSTEFHSQELVLSGKA